MAKMTRKQLVWALVEECISARTRLDTVEATLAPVLWICAMPMCGAPNTSPRIMFPPTAWSLPLCATCWCQQPWDHMKSFL